MVEKDLEGILLVEGFRVVFRNVRDEGSQVGAHNPHWQMFE